MRLGVASSLIAASVAIHGGAFYLTDQAFISPELKKAQQEQKEFSKKGLLDLQFVEAPEQLALVPPKETKRVSNRDALSQDLKMDKTNAGDIPATELEGAANQLAQKQGSAAAEAQPAQEEKMAMQAAPAAPPAPPVPQAPTDPAEASLQETSVVPSPQPQAQAQPTQQPQQAAPARTIVEGLSGKDKITTPEMSKTKANAAKMFGLTSFEATGSGMGAYMKNLKEKVWLAWFPYLAFKYPQDFEGADVILSFTLTADGRLTVIRVEEIEGDESFATLCVEALQKAAPGFGPPPAEIMALVGDTLEIKFGFHYR